MTMLTGSVLATTAWWVPQTVQAQEHAQHGAARHGLEIPAALRHEHMEIHERLASAAQVPGNTGAAARAVAAVLGPHFEREEQIALPPLGLLQRLARGEYDDAMHAVLPMTDSLAAELPRMLEEHVAISAATRRLRDAAAADGNDEVARLAEELLLHAQTEEQVLYPAAVLVGAVVRTRAAPPVRKD